MKKRSIKSMSLAMAGFWIVAAAGVAPVQGADAWTWGGIYEWSPSRAPGLPGLSSVAVGNDHVLAVSETGTVFSWGKNDSGQLGNGTTVDSEFTKVQVPGLSSVAGVAAGRSTSMAWKSDGSLWAWGSGGNTTPTQVQGLANVKAASGDIALKNDGTVWTIGNSYTPPVKVSGVAGVIAIAASSAHSAAVQDDGSVWTWGDNAYGQLGDGTTATRANPVQVLGLAGVSAVAAGDTHTVARKSDGSVWAWGDNTYGQLGNGTTNRSLTPVKVSGLSGVIAVAAGKGYSVALKSDGSVWCWGDNQRGLLCDGTLISHTTPVQALMDDGGALDHISAIAAGFGRVCALRTTDTVAPVSRDSTVACGNDRTTKISLPYTDRDSRPYEMSVSVSVQPQHGTLIVGYGPSVYYTPVMGYQGQDSFTWTIRCGVYATAPKTCTLNVASTPPPGTRRVALIVNAGIYPSISNEVVRMKNDMRWEGYDAYIQIQSYTADLALWNYLKDQYANNNLRGAVLIGKQPEGKSVTEIDGVLDGCFGNMTEFKYAWTTKADIWVSRIAADNNRSYTIGEVGMLKRALDANHYYRTGKLRYPHQENGYSQISAAEIATNYFGVWPKIKRATGAEAGSSFDGSSYFFLGAHGNAGLYGPINNEGIYRKIFQANLAGNCACGAEAWGNPMQNQIFTKYGGCVLSVPNFQDLGGEGGAPDNRYSKYSMHDMVLRGASIGEMYVAQHEIMGTSQNGDLSVQVMQSPPNAMPVVTSLTASKRQVLPGEPVTLTFAMSDPDGAGMKSPYLPFRHKVEWYMEGWDYGRKDATYTVDNTQSNWTQKTHAFNTPGVYTVRALVMDEWRAVGWKDIDILVDTPPVAVNDAVTVKAGYSTNIYVLANDSDADGQALTLNAVTKAPSHGRLDISGNIIIYTATNAIWVGTDSFVYQATDTLDVMNNATVTVTVVAPPAGAENNLPTAKNQSVTATEETPKTFALNAADADGDALARVMVTNPKNGTLSGTGVNVTYTPKPGYKGTDSFIYKMYDGKAYSAVASVSITVVNVNDPPTVTVSTMGGKTSGTAPLGIWFIATGKDVDGDALTYSWTFGDGGASTGSQTTYTYASAGTYIAKVTVSDGKGGMGSASITITVTSTSGNLAPTANAQSVTTAEDTAKAITLAGSDPEGSALTYSIVANPAHGTLSGSGASRTYTPAANYNGADSFTFKVNDGALDSTPATVSIIVTAVNDAPTCALTAPANGATFTAPASIALQATAADVDGTIAKVEFFNGATKLGEDTTSPYAYTWSGVAAGSYTLTAKATDNSGATMTSSARSVTITTAANQPPVAMAGVNPTTGSVTNEFYFWGTDSYDPDGTIVAYEWRVAGALVSTNAEFLYTFVTGGTYTVALTVRDNSGSVGAASASDCDVVLVIVSEAVLPAVSVTTSDAVAGEPGLAVGTGKFTISRSGDLTQAITVNYAMSGTAANGVDFTRLSGSVTLAAGKASASVTLTPLPDALVEGDETAILTLLPGVGYAADTNRLTGVVTIKDQTYGKPVVTAVTTDATAAEPGLTVNKGAIKVSRTGSCDQALTVKATLGGTAVNGVDYTAVTVPVTLAVGQSSKVLTIAPLADGVVEP